MDKSLSDQLQTQLDESRAQVEFWKTKEAEAKQNYETAMSLANQNVEALQSQITLSVGGTLFVTTKDTLLKVKGSYFTSLIESGCWKPQTDGSYFIDRNPTCFERIVDYMRYGKLNTTGLSEVEKEMLLIDFDYFFPKGKSVVPNDHWLANYANILQFWLGIPLDLFACLYKASKDGFAAKAFHKRCDKKGPTLTVIQSKKGWIFGGYNPKSWKSTGNHANSKDVFIFTLKNPHGIPPTRYFCKPVLYRRVLFNNIEYGPTFSDGFITLNSTYSGIYFPYGYFDTTGFGTATFTGDKDGRLEVQEVEVYAL